MNLFRLGPIALCLILTACQPGNDAKSTMDDVQSEAAAPSATGAAAIDVATFRQRVKTLSSDEFEGREPFTEGEAKTIKLISDGFRSAGAIPGNNGEWYQEVPLVEITPTAAEMSIVDGPSLQIGENAVIWTKQVTDQVEINNSEVVFVGYGIVAPEYDWNDYAGMDVEGKTVVMLVNDPGYATKDDALFNGNAMTYYGRWTYKYEEAARQGAAAALIIHETGPAGYPFQVVSNGWNGPRFDLVTADKNASRAKIEGWINSTLAKELLAKSGMTLKDAHQAALQSDFRPVPMSLTANGRIRNSIRESVSYNVLGLVPGTDLADEYIVYMAHWDHLGRDPSLEGDQIFNGAVDNATGTAALVEL
ncbi:MAG: M28 family peptidase, partial [Gammaproteobacteria bacterium]|nr:M28 family peptidase [Gammaproteobacteria bacterium]